jgi:hypothetical protein
MFLLSVIASTQVVAQQQPAKPQPPLEERVAAAAAANRYRLAFDGSTFSGDAWTRLIEAGKSSQFFALAEEHGIAENPKMAAALFAALGYSKFAIEVSPPVARELDRAARTGVGGLRKHYQLPGGEPAFFGMKEEAEMLAAVRAASKSTAPVLWGVDYEVGGDRLLISLLEKKSMPEGARKALGDLKSASDKSWAQYAESRNPQFIYSFSGDPALVSAVREKWPNADAESSEMLETLEQTFAINRLWVTGKRWESNERRSEHFRRNFIRHWQAEKKAGRTPKVFVKLGASHLVRGRNFTETWDLGALLPEIAALEGSKSFHLLVLPGAGSKTAVFDPSAWTYKPAPAKDDYAKGLEPILSAAYPDAFTLIDLRALRPVVASSSQASPSLMRTVHGFDALLVMSGSTASGNLSE